MRPKKDETMMHYTISVLPSTIKQVDELAAELGMTRGHLMRAFIEGGVADMKKIKKAGGIKIVRIGERVFADIRRLIGGEPAKLKKDKT